MSVWISVQYNPVNIKIIASFKHKLITATPNSERPRTGTGWLYAGAAETLRAESMRCQRVHLFVRTSPVDERALYYSEQAGVRLVCPSDDTRLLLQQVNVLLPQIWRDGHRYQKGGAMLSEFTPKGQ